MANAAIAIKRMLPWEIKDMNHPYTNDPNDPGGETCWGITKVVAVENGYTGSMIDMPLEFAIHVYTTKYWNLMELDGVDCQEIADQIFQAGVNQGESRWEFYVQRACNQLLPGYVRLLTVDGQIGPNTIRVINQLAKTDRVVLSGKLYDMQEKRYDENVQNNPKMQWARGGWSNRAKTFKIAV